MERISISQNLEGKKMQTNHCWLNTLIHKLSCVSQVLSLKRVPVVLGNTLNFQKFNCSF